MSDYVSIQTAASLTSLSEVTIRRRIADGTIPAVRVGRLIRIPRAALEQLGRPVTPIARSGR